jgi:VanZ family protein
MTLKAFIKELNPVFLSLSLLMTLLIWTNSLLPGELSSNQSGFFVGIASNILQRVNMSVPTELLSFWMRKIAHFTQFFILGMLWMITMAKSQLSHQHAIFIVLMIGLMTALVDEGIQMFVPDRGPSLIDVLIDWVGIITSVLIFQLYHQLKMSRQKHAP